MTLIKINRKILVIENSTGITGAFKSVFSLTNSIRENFIFHFAIQKNSPVKEILKRENIPWIEIPFLEIGKNINLIFYIPRLLINSWITLRYCQRHDITVVHVNDLYNMIGVIIKLFRRRIKIIYHIRLLPDSYAAKLYSVWRSIILRFADELVAVSEAVLKAFDNNSKINLIYDFIPLQQQWGFLEKDPARVTFLYPANYMQGKGQDFALQAFINLIKLKGDCRLQFVGSDLGLRKNFQFRKELEKKALAFGILEKISFEDGNANIERLMKSSDVVLNFSESESFSMVCYEALVYGCPLISTDCGGPRELIEDKVTGILVGNKDVAAMTSAMLALANELSFRIALGKNARIQIQQKVTEHNASRRLALIYGRLFKSGEVTS